MLPSCRGPGCWCFDGFTRPRSTNCLLEPSKYGCSRCRSNRRLARVLIAMADGDGRAALTLAEELWRAARPSDSFEPAALGELLQRRAPVYDKNQEGHYNLISALHKAVRGSDADAALYYLCRMLIAGEDPLFIARRVVRMAVEDVGLADPQAVLIATAAKDAYDFLGSPEGELALAQAVIYVATAPKSNAVISPTDVPPKLARRSGSLLPPKHILNAPTGLMRAEGYGEGYVYDHDQPGAFSGQRYFPAQLEPEIFYHPSNRGFEREIRSRLEQWAKLRATRPTGPDTEANSSEVMPSPGVHT